MNKILFTTAILSLLAVSCKSPEEKANALIEEDVKKMLYYAESYDPVETVVDSAFTPFDSPIFYDKAIQSYQFCKTIAELKHKMKSEKISMFIHRDGPYQSALDKDNYQEAKNKYNEYDKQIKSLEMKIAVLANELIAMLNEEEVFIGYKVYHRYRAKNRAGEICFDNMEYMFNKDLDQIVASYDMDNNEYKAIEYIYNHLIEIEEELINR